MWWWLFFNFMTQHETLCYLFSSGKQQTGTPCCEKAMWCAPLLTFWLCLPSFQAPLAPSSPWAALCLPNHAEHSQTRFLCLELFFPGLCSSINLGLRPCLTTLYRSTDPISWHSFLCALLDIYFFILSPCILEGGDLAYFVYYIVGNIQKSVCNVVEI